MLEVHPLPDWEIHLLERIQALLDFVELVFSINVVDRIVQGFQVAEVSINLSKVVSSLNRVNWTLKCFQISHFRFNFRKLMFPIY